MSEQASPDPNAPATDSAPVPEAAPASTGGSPAAQAFRQQQAKSGAAEPPKSAAPAAPIVGVDARGAKRVKVNGRARVVLGQATGATGKLIDMSETGLGLMMDDMPPAKLVTGVQCDIFHNGKRFFFNAAATCVYGVLASGKGFKVGFQFGNLDPAAKKAVTDIVI
jgi:hypothetical protein